MSRPLLVLHSDDNIAIAKCGVEKGTEVQLDGGPTITTQDLIDLGHKVASRRIAAGEAVRKFGQMIGFATEDIEAGQWIHTHNLSPGELSLDYSFSTDVPEPPVASDERTFMGYKRASGRVGTRNYVGIISTVNCSATTSKYAVDQINKDIINDYPNIDGLIALTHKGGCAFSYDGDDHRQLSRTMAGFANHPNIGAYIIIGLGCETAQPGYLAQNHGLVQLAIPGQEPDELPLIMNIQDVGGVRKTVERATAVLKELLPEANKVQREPVPVSEIILGTECGGSDGNSGITCNPAVGVASDLLVAHGATSILAEVPEIYGAEHILTRRAVSRDVGEKLIKRIKWWEQYAAMFGAEIDNNPSVGNKKGGLTTIYEKSLGAIAKGGSTALRGVYEYGELVTDRGFVIMDTPGFDAASVTGMVAGGANVVVFTTGRGSCYGCKPVPTIKVSSNTPMYERMSEDMDINAGRILDGASVADVGEEIFEMIIAVASGDETKSEAQGIGDEEFCPWVPGPVL